MKEQNNFNSLFDQWAITYDRTVYDDKGEYREVFAGYNDILNEVVTNFRLPNASTIVEIGVGSGNLSQKLLDAGYDVIGIEPSEEMRKLAQSKLPELKLFGGSFLSFPNELKEVNGFASTYAFHHLTDEEKAKSLELMHDFLVPKGKVVFADTSYKDETAKRQLFEEVEQKDQMNLLNDLRTEFYTFIDVHRNNFEKAGFTFSCQQLNKFVWMLIGEKK